MQLRQNAGSRPQITFTSDFHELVRGDLVPGPCLLRYDPLRLVSLGDAATEHHVIRAYVRFHPVGSEWQGTMDLPPGLPLAEQADITGDGIMLTCTFDIPAGCDELEVWFSCTHDNGQTHWDSDLGRNHWLRFGLADLKLKTAKVRVATKKAAAQDVVEFEFVAKPAIHAVNVRWRLTNQPQAPRVDRPLVCTAETPQGKTWSAPNGGFPVPKGAVVAFDVVYKVGDQTYTDDNQGRRYLAD